RLEKSRLSLSHPCEVRMVYNHNHRVEPDQSKNNNNITTTTLNSHIMSSTLVPPPFMHETYPPSIGTTPLGTPLIGTPSDTTTVTDSDNITTSTNLLPSLSSSLAPFSHTSIPIPASTSTSPLLPFSQPPIPTSTSTTPPLPTTNNRYHSPQKLLTALTQFTRE